MTNLNSLVKSIIPQYEIPTSGSNAIGRVAALTAVTAVSYFIADEKTGVEILDDYLFPIAKGTLLGLTGVSVALAGDFFLCHNNNE